MSSSLPMALLEVLSCTLSEQGVEIHPKQNDGGLLRLIEMIDNTPDVAGLDPYRISGVNGTLRNARRKALVEWIRRVRGGAGISPPRFAAFVALASRHLNACSAKKLLELLKHHDARRYHLGPGDTGQRLAQAKSAAESFLNAHSGASVGAEQSVSKPGKPADSELGPRVFVLFTRMEKGTPDKLKKRASRICEHVGKALARAGCLINIGGKYNELTVACCEAFKQQIGPGRINARATTYSPTEPDHDHRGKRWKSYRLGKVMRCQGRSFLRRPTILAASDVLLVCAGIHGPKEYIETHLPRMPSPIPVVAIPQAGSYSEKLFNAQLRSAALGRDRHRMKLLQAIAAEPLTESAIADAVVDLVLYEHRTRMLSFASPDSER
ncbi:MAG: hypothetical protein IT432_04130 [Phycisphaerales bacterium]|nr:hypothetical protein [Phycisphaerales bacterium]